MERILGRAARDCRLAQILITPGRTQSVEHALRDRQAPLLARETPRSGAEYPRDPHSERRHGIVREHTERAMRFVKHPASPALARDTQETRAVRTRRVHVVVDQGTRRVADPESRAGQPRRHLRLLLVTGGPRSQPFVEEADPDERGGTKRHVGAQDAAHLDNPIAVVGDRKIEPYGGFGADLGRWILGRQDPPLHRGELGMFAEKFLHFVEITRRSDKVVVKAYNYVSDGLPDGYVLDPAFAGARVVQVFQGRRRRGERRRRGRAVFGEKDFARRFARGAG